MNSSKQNKVVLVVVPFWHDISSDNFLPFGRTLPSGESAQVRITLISDIYKGMAVLSHLIYEDFAPILFGSYVPFIPSPPCSKIPVSGHSSPWSPHFSSLSSQSLKWSISSQIHIIHSFSWKVLFPQQPVLWHTHLSPSWLMSKHGFNVPGRITAHTELKYNYTTVSQDWPSWQKNYEKTIKVNWCFMVRNAQRHKNRKKKNSLSPLGRIQGPFADTNRNWGNRA